MQKVLETSMEHDQTSAYLSRLITECMKLRYDQGADTAICYICEERMVELAIRKEWDELAVLTECVLMWEPKVMEVL